MKVLVACEESQAVCIAFRNKGHEAYSCDLLPCSGGRPEWHIQGDALDMMGSGRFFTQSRDYRVIGEWDLMIAFPPCTHLSKAGAAYWKEKRVDGRQQLAINFVLNMANQKCEKIAIENPVGILSTVWRKPEQIIQPWQFGDAYKKTTCLWLKDLAPLISTNIVEPAYHWHNGSSYKLNGVRIKSKLPAAKGIRGSTLRSKTFPGIAAAMADQWG